MAMIFSPPTSAPASKGPIPKPPKKVLEVVHKATPVLLLQRAQLDTPWVEFGSIPLGSVHELKLKMFNPGKSSVTVKLHKISDTKGFSVSDMPTTVGPGSSTTVGITWAPNKAGGCRDNVEFKLSKQRWSMRVVFIGTAEEWKPTRKKRKARRRLIGNIKIKTNDTIPEEETTTENEVVKPSPVKRSSESVPLDDISTKENTNRSNFKGVKKARSVVIPEKQSKTSKISTKTHKKKRRGGTKSKPKDVKFILRRGRKTSDKMFAEKQAEGFKVWMNHIFNEFKHEAGGHSNNTSRGEADDTADARALFLLTRQRRRALTRRRAASLWNELSDIEDQINDTVLAGNIRVRLDRELHADVGLQSHITQLLFSYNRRWLTLGIETVFGEILPLTSARALRHFIKTRLLRDPKLDADFSGTVEGLLSTDFAKATHQHTLRKFLMLVLFLDEAVMLNDVAKQRQADGLLSSGEGPILCNAPCLFRTDGEALVKTSKDILISFAKETLSGEGNIVRHLKSFGYELRFEQTWIHETDYTITDLPTAFCDGLRLTRIAEILTDNGRRTLSRRLRVGPNGVVGSRLPKVHNVGVALQRLVSKGLSLTYMARKRGGKTPTKIVAKDITDGNREKTLALLWRIVATFGIETLINVSEMAMEVARLRGKRNVNEEGNRILNEEVNEDVESNICVSLGKEAQILLIWCGAVCKKYSITIENFTTSFADGRAICFLIHHYIPSLVPISSIHTGTTVDLQKKNGCVDRFGSCGDVSEEEYATALAAEKANFTLVNERVNTLGCVPIMLGNWCADDLPEEKVMVTFLSYLCNRLMESSATLHACGTIQQCWRRVRHKFRARRLLLEKKAKAAARRAAALVYFKTQEKATITAQRVMRGWMMRLKLERSKLFSETLSSAAFVAYRAADATMKAYTTASSWVGHATQVKHQKLLARLAANAATVSSDAAGAADYAAEWAELEFSVAEKARCERLIAGAAAVAHSAMNAASEATQNAFASVRVIEEKIFNEKKRSASVYFQSLLRGYVARKKYTKVRYSALVLQTMARRRNAENMFRILKDAVITLQTHTRKYLVRKKYRKSLHSCIKIQAFVRTYQAQKIFQNGQKATIIIQARVRCFIKQIQLKQMRFAAISIQSRIRSQLAYTNFTSKRNSAIIIQNRFRTYMFVKKFKHANNAVIVIQASIRSFLAQNNFQNARKSVTILQNMVRVILAKHMLYIARCAATTIQTCFRSYRIYSRYKKMKNATIMIQGVTRCRMKYNLFCRMRRSCIVLQTMTRRKSAQNSFYLSRTSIILLQSVIRQWLAKSHFNRSKQLIIKLQNLVRVRAARRAYNSALQQSASIKIQVAVRGYLARNYLKESRNAIITLQSMIRMHADQMLFYKTREAVIILQAFMRKNLEEVKYIKLRKSVIKMQSVIRQHISQKKFNVTRQSVIKIQSITRMRVTKNVYTKTRTSIITMQSTIRKNIAMKMLNTSRKAVIILQRMFRKHVAQVKFLRACNAVVIIQSSVRMLVARKTYFKTCNLIITIQALARRQAAKKRFKKLQVATIKVQSCVRSRIAYVSFFQARTAVITLQAMMRKHAAQNLLSISREAAITLQSVMRQYSSQKSYIRARESTIILQSNMRRYLAQNMFFNTRVAIVTLQSIFRMHAVHKKFENKRKVAIAMQSIVRRNAACAEYTKFRDAVVRLQSLARMHFSKRFFRKSRKAIVTLQASVRRYSAVLVLLKCVKSAVIIQSFIRCQTRKKLYLEERKSAIILQTTLRKYLAIKSFNDYLHSCTLVQSWTRKVLAKRVFQRTKQKIIIIQSLYRRVAAIDTFQKLRKAVVKIQSISRGWLYRLKSNTKHQATITISCWLRSCIIRWRREEAAPVIQAWWRRMCARPVIRSWTHLVCVIVSSQARFRAYLARRKASRKVRIARVRVRKATAHAKESMKLGNRVTVALNTLKHSRQLSAVTHACVALEVSTRLSFKCCERFANNGAASTIFEFLATCNRSQPHVELQKVALRVLLNVAAREAKHQKRLRRKSRATHDLPSPWMVAALAVDGFSEVLVGLMQASRDRPALFLPSTKMLRLLCLAAPENVLVIKDDPSIMKRLLGLQRLAHRKKGKSAASMDALMIVLG